MHDLITIIEAKTTEFEKMLKDINYLKKEISTYTLSLDELESAADSITNSDGIDDNEEKNLEVEIKDLELKLKESETEKRHLNDSFYNKRKRIDLLSGEINNHDQNKENTVKEINNVNLEINRIESKVKQHNSDLFGIQDTVRNGLAEVNALLAQKKELNSELLDINDEINDLEDTDPVTQFKTTAQTQLEANIKLLDKLEYNYSYNQITEEDQNTSKQHLQSEVDENKRLLSDQSYCNTMYKAVMNTKDEEEENKTKEIFDIVVKIDVADRKVLEARQKMKNFR